MHGLLGTVFACLEILSVCLLAGVTLDGIQDWRATTPVGHGLRFRRAAMLVPYVAACLVLNRYAFHSILAYVITGGVWGLLLPVRVLIYGKIVSGGTPRAKWSRPFTRRVWENTAVLVIVHAIFWPVSIPILYYLENRDAMTE